ncbi:cell division protein SepF [Fructobacillus fructosus]|uniref:Cell division protein SepF n=1 Tax=Fructobacillus fructosus TaxID=1631 RepID=A0ABM9MLK8_9LACO|nr:cell division protein SepF [Fructobacillus fructosus]MBD9364397.1 cell division protein SepF [Leuconostoc mesenteroides]KRN53336.1 cell division protein [Fructobacillus fructosus KCTC 3544]MBC9118177.1 cell division protein SepF [Fructobacillus fructosus]MCK8638187.1 cell division protein SepF [Fructobacillus fructosus]CAK1223791.1 Cell division protein SepF/YlmF [Fructobacillus fructosus]
MAFDKIKTLFSGDDDYYDEEYEEVQEQEPVAKQAKPMTAVKKQAKTVANQGNVAGSSTRIALFEPKVYADSRAIASQVIEGDAVIVNFSQLEEEPARRILDYIGGAVYAVDGSMERIGEKIFLLTPSTYEVAGSMSENLDNQSRY